MQAWRLCRARFADLTGEGASMAGGRWNSPGRPAVYLADHPALCVLEVRVHLDLPLGDLPADYVLLRIDLGGMRMEAIGIQPAEPRFVGDTWLREGRAALLGVSSVIVPHCRNFVLNPLHRDAATLEIVETTPYRFDGRLWS